MSDSITLNQTSNKHRRKHSNTSSDSEPQMVGQKSGGTKASSSSKTKQAPKIETGAKLQGAAQNDMKKLLSSLRKEQSERISKELQQLERINELMREVEMGRADVRDLQALAESKLNKR